MWYSVQTVKLLEAAGSRKLSSTQRIINQASHKSPLSHTRYIKSMSRAYKVIIFDELVTVWSFAKKISGF